MTKRRRAQPEYGPLLAGFVAGELARAQRLLAREGEQLNAGIHQGRKSLRRSRAALALGAGALGATAARIDRGIRAVCRSLSRERDAQAVIDTLRSVAATGSGLQRGDARLALKLLRERRDAILAARLARDPGLAAARGRIERLAARAAALPWERVEPRHVHEALTRSLRRCDRAERRALASTDPEDLHRWRRRLRRLRQQIAALERLTGLDWREYAAVPDPADALSEAQDLEVLTAVLRRLPGAARELRLRLLDAVRPLETLAESVPVSPPRRRPAP
jgi:CHAD domain-containing protein